MYDVITGKISECQKIVFFTGAGMSTESGIPDFRSATGLYSENEFMGMAPEYILSRTFFMEHTDVFYRYYFQKIVHEKANPNAGHEAIVSLEDGGREITVITQNIDGLHEAAGSSNVLELHGSVYRNYCMDCRAEYDLQYMLRFRDSVPVCSKCSGIVRPDVTLYEEPLEQEVFARAVSRISDADAVIAIGSSLTVQPAAGLLRYFKGKIFVILNMDVTDYDHRADYIIREGCGMVLQEIAGIVNAG